MFGVSKRRIRRIATVVENRAQEFVIFLVEAVHARLNIVSG